jgi:hypothetical protein
VRLVLDGWLENPQADSSTGVAGRELSSKTVAFFSAVCLQVLTSLIVSRETFLDKKHFFQLAKLQNFQ